MGAVPCSLLVVLAFLLLSLVFPGEARRGRLLARTDTADLSQYAPTLSNGKASLCVV